ncbi:MAG TPA: hypothetical protein VFP20_06370 [Bacteroidales bacterium]|nr:hypothetical protein [Bacteroidales bacterium]
MKYLLLSLIFIIFFSCTENDTGIKYTQFTSDDLSYLYFNSDTLVFTGSNIQYVDTISFMLESTDIVKVSVDTRIGPVDDPFSFINEIGIQGESTLRPINEVGFRYANVYVSRHNHYDVGSNKMFYVGVNKNNSYSTEISMNDPITFDTALVLGVHYENVLKFYPDSLLHTNIKSIYFAKKYGYIKIETLDGKTMERVLPR